MTPRLPSLCLAALALAGLSCAALRSRELTPDELGELARRELDDPLPFWTVRLDDGVAAQAEALVAPAIRPAADGQVLALGLGTESPLTCKVLRGPIEGGALIMARIAEAATAAEVRGVEVSAVEPAGGAAVLFVEATYLSRDGRSTGTLKLAVAPGAKRSFACEHDEVGYSRTFRRVVVQLVASARRAGETPPDFFDVLELKLDGQLAGLVTRHQETKGPTSVFTTTSIELQPIGDGHLRSVDGLRSEASDQDGLVWLHRTRVAIDGKLDLDLTARRKQGSASDFTVEGTLRGQPIHAPLRAELGLTSTPLLASRIAAELLRARNPGLQAFSYEPTKNPTTPTSTFYRLLPDGLVADTTSGFKAEVEPSGLFKSWTVKSGPFSLSASRVSVHGALLSKVF